MTHVLEMMAKVMTTHRLDRHAIFQVGLVNAEINSTSTGVFTVAHVKLVNSWLFAWTLNPLTLRELQIDWATRNKNRRGVSEP